MAHVFGLIHSFAFSASLSVAGLTMHQHARSCLLWNQPAQTLQQLLAERGATRPEDCVFAATTGEAMTRFGIYKRVRTLVGDLDGQQTGPKPVRRITPHVFRHTTTVHLMEAGV